MAGEEAGDHIPAQAPSLGLEGAAAEKAAEKAARLLLKSAIPRLQLQIEKFVVSSNSSLTWFAAAFAKLATPALLAIDRE